MDIKEAVEIFKNRHKQNEIEMRISILEDELEKLENQEAEARRVIKSEKERVAVFEKNIEAGIIKNPGKLQEQINEVKKILEGT